MILYGEDRFTPAKKVAPAGAQLPRTPPGRSAVPREPAKQQVAPAMAQVVKNDCLMPIFRQQPGDGTTYIPRAAYNQYLHKKAVPFQKLWFSLNSSCTFSKTLV